MKRLWSIEMSTTPTLITKPTCLALAISGNLQLRSGLIFINRPVFHPDPGVLTCHDIYHLQFLCTTWEGHEWMAALPPPAARIQLDVSARWNLQLRKHGMPLFVWDDRRSLPGDPGHHDVDPNRRNLPRSEEMPYSPVGDVQPSMIGWFLCKLEFSSY